MLPASERAVDHQQVVVGLRRRDLPGRSGRDRVTGIVDSVPAGGLFVLIGAEPFTEWLPEPVLRDQWGYVLTGSDIDQDRAAKRAPFPLETSRPGVFAVGDVRHGSVKRVASAVGEGSICIRMVHEYLALAS